MEENRKGPGVFYAVIGVATLVVAIVGATFAYFTATQSNTDTITGEAAAAGLGLEVKKVSTDADGKLIPIADGTSSVTGYTTNLLDKALAGDAATDNKMCVDKDGNTVCQVYEFKVTNSGTAAAALDGSLTLTATGYTNLKWANNNKGAGLAAAADPTTATNLNASSVTEVTTNEVFSAGATKYYYVVIYISETGASQNEADKGSFTGVVTFNSAGGKGTTATFSA